MTIEKLLDAVLPHVPFDGWSAQSIDAAVDDLGMAPADVQVLCPRGALDLAVAYHKRGDGAMTRAMSGADLAGMRYSEKVAHAIWLRLAHADREVVRKGASLFALPQNAGDGAALIWGTADAIWRTLGDTSDDVNWYTKRATLSAVYGSAVLFWLGDDSVDGQATRDFIARRIDNVMAFEKVKAQARENKLLSALASPLEHILGAVKAPSAPPDDLPGHWNDKVESPNESY